jgi:L-threonylcarbamoyladenylate synthase
MTAIVPPTPENLARAGEILRAGGLVAFPTETVYGLGANALDPAAVANIFAAKDRPPGNPLIVHAASFEAIAPLVDRIPQQAKMLAERFWPGPLTLVLPKSSIIPDIVTAGGSTVGVRVPNHVVALDLLRAAGVPLAAPSANPSMRISPTRAEHVLRGLDGKVDLILDGGPTSGGIESTVLDVTLRRAVLLRPGLITAAMIESLIGPVRKRSLRIRGSPVRSPGLQEKHYAPRTPLELVCDNNGEERVRFHLRAGLRVGWLTLGPPNCNPPPGVRILEMPIEPEAFAARLYDALHLLDEADFDVIVAQNPPETEVWTAVHDRLSRAGRFSD